MFCVRLGSEEAVYIYPQGLFFSIAMCIVEWWRVPCFCMLIRARRVRRLTRCDQNHAFCRVRTPHCNLQLLPHPHNQNFVSASSAARRYQIMTSTTSPAEPALSEIQKSLLSLLSQCRDSLTSATELPTPVDNALSLLHSAATLAKAHITRLAVALRPPISPEIAVKFAGELRDTVVPSLTAAAASLRTDRDKVGHVLAQEAVRSTVAVLKALEEFVGDIGKGEDRLVNTGIVWSAIDGLLAAKDCATVVEKVLDAAGELIKDAGEELKEWIEEEEGDDEDDDEDEHSGDDGEFEDKFFGSKNTGSKDKAVLERAKMVQKRIRLTLILITAAKKRRLAEGAEGRISDVKRLDTIAAIAKEMEVLVDDLGSAIYDEEDEEAVNSPVPVVY